ncbi:hypothetical protein DFR49_1285 [Hephaestia caeni]|uniref:DUF6878 domain-containing protein n=1 Tax=Hephaestia caeni TaxID=645617 RepID=A0A397PM06_9SPHN|nr:DUF6878 family protein [Hephaestia caeni]RIA46731.1 hypothetical protein DFR49_1285 [Hephaestia caeni]
MTKNHSPLDLAETMRKYRTWEAAAAELVPENRQRLFAFLGLAPVTRVIVTFDGEGDSGQIEDIQPYNGEAQVDLPKGKIAFFDLPYGKTRPKQRKFSACQALEYLAYDLLRQKHSGWENSDGAYGEFTFDVTAGTITLDYNERFMSSEHYQYSL